jgi:hypothetical protein
MRRERVRDWRATRQRRVEPVVSGLVGAATAPQSVAGQGLKLRRRRRGEEEGGRRRSGVQRADIFQVKAGRHPVKISGLSALRQRCRQGGLSVATEGGEEERLRGRKARRSKRLDCAVRCSEGLGDIDVCDVCVGWVSSGVGC